MNLPKNAEQLAAGFTKLTPKRKDEILDHLRGTAGTRAQATISQIIANGGDEKEFIIHVFGKEVVDAGAAPDNKKINPPQTK